MEGGQESVGTMAPESAPTTPPPSTQGNSPTLRPSSGSATSTPAESVATRSCDPPTGTRKTTRRRWTEADDYLCVKAVVSDGAHIAPYGQRTRRFAAAAAPFNAHPQTTFKVQGKNVRDRFYLLKEHFVSENKTLARK